VKVCQINNSIAFSGKPMGLMTFLTRWLRL